jgi:hypothetical protein
MSVLSHEARQALESSPIPKDVRDVQRCMESGLDPLHSAYVSAQNLTSFFAEAVSVLDEFEPYYEQVTAAEETYMPDGPPMSPLTRSYFTTWAFFDFRFGRELETMGTCLLDVSDVVQMDPLMVQVIRLFQESRMGIYERRGTTGSRCELRELVTGNEFICHVASGYSGKEGELWYARLCPPLLGLLAYHVVFTTPYVLLDATKADWMAYLKKSLLGTRHPNTAQGLHEFLKYGRQWDTWHEFIVLAYHHHQSNAIFLAGLPDVRGSMPHAT